MYQLQIDGVDVGVPVESFLDLDKWAEIAISAGAQLVQIWRIVGNSAHVSESYTGNYQPSSL